MGCCHAEAGGNIGIDRLHLGAEPRPHDLAAADASLRHELGHIGRDGKADADRAAGLGINRGVDPHQMPIEIDERAARIARIYRRICLDEEFIIGTLDPGAGERRHNAAGNSLADAERIADRQHEIADFEGIGIGEGDGGEHGLGGITDAQHSQIGLGVLDHHIDGKLAAIGQRDAHIGGAFNDVAIGEDHPARIDNDARAERARFPGAALELPLPEKAREEWIIGKGRRRLLLNARGIDIDHRGRDGLDHRRKGQLDLGVAGGHLRLHQGHGRRRCGRRDLRNRRRIPRRKRQRATDRQHRYGATGHYP